jgi:hypothetical protein
MRKIAVLTVAVVSLIMTSYCIAEEASLMGLFKDKQPIKVFLKDFANESGKNQIIAEDFRKSVENAMLSRKSIKFEVVNDAGSSDIQVSAIIKKYQYLDKGPMKPTLAPGGFFIEMAATAAHNYAEMTVEYTVIDTKTSNVLWKDTLTPYVKKTMTPDESVPMVYKTAAKNFLWRAFGKRMVY